jgi:short subunit dehydrogenase-like uncharacterized protein
VSGRIVLFGATGYTGELTARALVRDGARPLLAGRSQPRLEALASELGGLEWALADVDRPASVRELVGAGDVLISTVGPFVRWGQAAVNAAIDAGAHYLDSTGESRFIREIFERYSPRAQTAGSALLTAFGADWVPGNLAGALALEQAGERAARVQIGYFITGEAMGPGAMSGGTRASAAGVMLEPDFAFRGGRIVSERGAKRVRHFEIGAGRRAPAISLGSTEHLALPRLCPSLREVDVYLGWFGPASQAMRVLSLGTSALRRVPGAKRTVEAALAGFVKGSTGGPDEAMRARSGSLVLAEAFDPSGISLSKVRLEGVNGYDFTGRILAWGAQRAAEGGLQGTGALGPADGFALAALKEGCAHAGLEPA